MNKKELIKSVLDYELKVFQKNKKESIKDLSDWFNTDKISLKNCDKWFNSYLDDLYIYLLDYNLQELKERLKGLKQYLKQMKGGLKKNEL